MDLDGLRQQAENLLEGHGDEVEKAITKAEELAKGKISGHDGQIDQVADRLRDFVSDHDTSGAAAPAAKAPGGRPRPAAKAPGKHGGKPAAKQAAKQAKRAQPGQPGKRPGGRGRPGA